MSDLVHENSEPAGPPPSDLVDALAFLMRAYADLKYGRDLAASMERHNWRIPFANPSLERAARALRAYHKAPENV